MRNAIHAVTIVLMVLLISSCASGPEIVQWTYQKDAIILNIDSDAKLNIKGNKGHKLALCVYQLRDPSMFDQLSSTEQGLYKLLECANFDPGVLSSSRVFVDPGKDAKKSLDRADGAKFVAVIAGYYKIEKDKITRIYQIPEVKQKYGFLKMKKKTVPGVPEIKLNLGPKEILSK